MAPQDEPQPPKESVLSKFFAINSKPTKETFPELPNVIVWFRFLLAIAYGVWLGMNPGNRAGGVNLLYGLNFITFLPVLYCSTFLGADQDSYENKIIFTGVLSSLALMLLIWTYMYTLQHENDTQALLTILINAMPKNDEDSIINDGANSENLESIASSAATQETEF
jgi:hypothetical protein